MGDLALHELRTPPPEGLTVGIKLESLTSQVLGCHAFCKTFGVEHRMRIQAARNQQGSRERWQPNARPIQEPSSY